MELLFMICRMLRRFAQFRGVAQYHIDFTVKMSEKEIVHAVTVHVAGGDAPGAVVVSFAKRGAVSAFV